ncbi:MAG TPA: acyl carrier protein [Methylophilaceae bacterium]|jgi:acyl carrier protein
MDSTLQVLTKIIADKLEVDPSTITPESTLEDLGLDSLDTFDIIFNAEDAFKIKVPNDQVTISTLQDVVDLVDRLIKEQHPA